ncbi:MAG: DUF2490 domain-containing protein [Cytophagaceae bacterium]
MRVRLFLIFLTLYVFPSELVAQNQPRPSSYGQWFMYFGDNKINKRWGIHSELQLRNYPLQNTVQQTLIRPGINFYAGPNTMLTAGYAFLYTHPGSQNITGSTLTENRLWQQVLLRHQSRIIILEHRYRLEQRFIQNHTTDAANFENRIRYRLQALFPLSNLSSSLKQFFINSYNELFVNFAPRQSGHVIDRNRLYFAGGVRFNPKTNMQIGYLNQVIYIPGKANPDITHNLQVGIFYNFMIGRSSQVND